MCFGEIKQNVSNGSEANIYDKKIGTDPSYRHAILWTNSIVITLLHIFGAFGLYKLLSASLKYTTILLFVPVYFLLTVSISAGTHRYFTHKSYKASSILRILFIFFLTMAGQNSIFIWVRDHRLHHRYSDTDADPHNSKRGFFFSHMGWLMTKKHPYVVELGRKIDMSDLKADSWVMWQYRHFYVLLFLIGVYIPVAVPVYFGESWINSILFMGFFRYIISLHITGMVNSVAHLYGTRPYDKNLNPVENSFVSFWTLGEGWHNYHHVFPWDYNTSELGMPYSFTSAFIRFCERIGLAYDLKTASPELVAKRIIRTGDGTHHFAS